jgi:phosphoribosylamine--glycine ligase
MRVLVIGSGGREHALVWKLTQSPLAEKIFCAPGNAGIAQAAACVAVRANDIQGLLSFAREEKIDLTVVGPESPLVDGIVDAFAEKGMAIFGPSKAAAQIEGSKAWCHAFMERHGIPCARSQTVTDQAAARQAAQGFGIPVVVKASGLAAGKGAIVCRTEEELETALQRLFVKREFGDAAAEVVVEEYLAGEEASCLALTDGVDFAPLAGSQDHKPVLDGDRGDNTGGMGAYAPAPILDAAMQKRVNRTILGPTIAGLAAEGIPYRGVLYAGLMIAPAGPKVIEFNCRFGDPETQAVLPLLDGDLLDCMVAVVEGRLGQKRVAVRAGSAVCVCLVSGGYPGPYEKGKPIAGLEAVPRDVMVFHAGTAIRGDSLVTAGGRVLGLTAVADDIRQAVDRVYGAVRLVSFDRMHYRTDIARRALDRLSSP